MRGVHEQGSYQEAGTGGLGLLRARAFDPYVVIEPEHVERGICCDVRPPHEVGEERALVIVHCNDCPVENRVLHSHLPTNPPSSAPQRTPHPIQTGFTLDPCFLALTN
jgi:hypothetical protein